MRELNYQGAFSKAFPNDADPLSTKNYGIALQAYQATLATPAEFDKFLGGHDNALSEQQKRGLRAFISTGCAGCHNGRNFGGTLFQKFGVVKEYWTETGSEKPDQGRFSMTKKEEDRFVFRVPMLRNVAKTAPYLHDGSAARSTTPRPPTSSRSSTRSPAKFPRTTRPRAAGPSSRTPRSGKDGRSVASGRRRRL